MMLLEKVEDKLKEIDRLDSEIGKLTAKKIELEGLVIEYYGIIEEKSLFGKDMFNILSKLMSWVENEKYQVVVFKEERKRHGYYEDVGVQAIVPVSLIDKIKSRPKEHYPYNSQDNGILIQYLYGYPASYYAGCVISETDKPSVKKLDKKFYKLYQNNIVSEIYYGKYTYLQEFVDYVISYRIDNNLEEITSFDLESLLNKFLEENPTLKDSDKRSVEGSCARIRDKKPKKIY